MFTTDPKCQYFIGNTSKSSMGSPCIPIRILHGLNLFTADPKCQYFIGNMCKCVRATLEEPGGAAGNVRGRFRGGSLKIRGRFREATGEPAPDPPCGHFYGTLIILLLQPASELAIREKPFSKMKSFL